MASEVGGSGAYGGRPYRPKLLPVVRLLRPKKGPDPCPERVALEHAIRRWGAECENAQRLSSRENGLLALLGVIAGLGFFRLSDIDKIEWGWALAAKLLLTAALGCVLFSVFKVFLVPKSRVQETRDGRRAVFVYASGLLAWPIQKEAHPNSLKTEEDAVRIAFAQTASAAASLYRRNLKRRESLERGQRYLVAAIGLAAVAALLRMFAPEQEKETPVSERPMTIQVNLGSSPREDDR